MHFRSIPSRAQATPTTVPVDLPQRLPTSRSLRLTPAGASAISSGSEDPCSAHSAGAAYVSSVREATEAFLCRAPVPRAPKNLAPYLVVLIVGLAGFFSPVATAAPRASAAQSTQVIKATNFWGPTYSCYQAWKCQERQLVVLLKAYVPEVQAYEPLGWVSLTTFVAWNAQRGAVQTYQASRGACDTYVPTGGPAGAWMQALPSGGTVSSTFDCGSWTKGATYKSQVLGIPPGVLDEWYTVDITREDTAPCLGYLSKVCTISQKNAYTYRYTLHVYSDALGNWRTQIF